MNRILVVYYSSTGNTKLMAEQIVLGIQSAGAEAVLAEVNEASIDGFDKIAFGCPAMGAEVLEENEFEPFFTSIEPQLANKKVALFGSFEWGDGQWMRDWQERVKADQALLFKEGLIINGTPDADGDAQAYAFGAEFVRF